MGSSEPLSPPIRTAVTLLALYLAAVVATLAVTLAETSPDVGLLTCVVVAPITVLSVVCIHLCRRRNLQGLAGALMQGVIGVGLRPAIGSQPSLEVGGGLPVWVSAICILLGALVTTWSVWSVLELRAHAAPR